MGLSIGVWGLGFRIGGRGLTVGFEKKQVHELVVEGLGV